MTRERWVQLVAGLVLIAALGGVMALTPTIKQQRADLRPNVEAAGLPPEYALLNTALGPFRGLFVDWLWYRTEQLKRENKIYEVNTNARWITTLQPRFPAVWAYHAWNMAYNISVKTDTEEERWNWVHKGIRLLREEGIPRNPKALYLYHELSRTFWHKLGQRADDMHYYYKQRLAEQWQKVLGDATLVDTQAQALERFEPIVSMAERYFMTDHPPRAVRDRLTALASAYPDYADRLTELKTTELVRGQEKLQGWRSQWREAAPELVSELSPIAQTYRELTSGNPLGRFEADHPEAAAVLASLRDAGLTLDAGGLDTLGTVLMKQYYQGTAALEANAGEWLTPGQGQLWSVVKEHQGGEPWTQALAYLRAKVLWHEYNMDPGFMRQVIDDYGPMDWRHPATHAIYWAARGVQVARTIRGDGSVDWVNTRRHIVHGLQMLFNNGRVHYSPVKMHPLEGEVRLLPDTRFVEAYEKAMRDTLQQLAERRGGDPGIDSFATGHENFLTYAIERTYLYGDREQARRFYEKLRSEYGQYANGEPKPQYRVPLAQFVNQQLQQDLGQDQETTRRFVEGFLRQAIVNGLATGQLQTFNNLTRSARFAHNAYATEGPGQHKAPIARERRLGLAPFDKMLIDTYVRVLASSSRPMIERRRIYGNTPDTLKRRAYPQLRQELQSELADREASVEQLFPPPEGVADGSPAAADAGS